MQFSSVSRARLGRQWSEAIALSDFFMKPTVRDFYHPLWRYLLRCFVRDLRYVLRNLYHYGHP